MKILSISLSGLVLAGATGTLLFAALQPDETAEEPAPAPLPVAIMEPEAVTTLSRDRNFTGTMTAARRTQLAFERSARLVEALCDEGDIVTKDDVLARLDHRQLDIRMQQLQAQLNQQRAVLQELQAGPRKETIASTEAALAALAADEELKRATLNRIDGLFRRDATSAQNLDEVRLGWKAAVARTDAMRRQLEELEAGTRQEKLTAQQAVVSQLEAQIASLQVDIDDSELKAPFAGTVTRRFADEGDMLNPGEPVFEVLETGTLEARIGVPSSLLPELLESDYVVLSVQEQEFTGRVRDVVPQVDEVTRTQTVIVTVDQPDGLQLSDGQLVRLRFDETIPTEGFRVPLSALTNGSRGLWTVYAVEPAEERGQGRIRSRQVEVLHTDGNSAVIRGTIYKSDQLVSSGLHRIVPGQLVAVSGTAEAGSE